MGFVIILAIVCIVIVVSVVYCLFGEAASVDTFRALIAASVSITFSLVGLHSTRLAGGTRRACIQQLLAYIVTPPAGGIIVYYGVRGIAADLFGAPPTGPSDGPSDREALYVLAGLGGWFAALYLLSGWFSLGDKVKVLSRWNGVMYFIESLKRNPASAKIETLTFFTKERNDLAGKKLAGSISESEVLRLLFATDVLESMTESESGPQDRNYDFDKFDFPEDLWTWK